METWWPFRRLLVFTFSFLTAFAAASTDASFSNVIPAADVQPQSWSFTTDDPGPDWAQPGFSDANWKHGKSGFGTKGTPGLSVGTEWKTKNIWLRRPIVLPNPLPAHLRLWMIYDENPSVYLNGKLAVSRQGYVGKYEEVDILPEARATLHPGTNLLAVRASQTWGGQGIDVGVINSPPYPASKNRWTPERANAWFSRQPLPIGFNYVPGNAISYTEMWMDYSFDPMRIDRELALAQDVGFNCLRVVLSYVVWERDALGFRTRFETFLSLAQKHGLQVIPCFFDDCVFGPIKDPEYGRQPAVVTGWYANGWTPSPGHQRARDPKARPSLQHYVKDFLQAHRHDPRILCWDLYNEPGNSGMGNDSVSLLHDVFLWAREVNPDQPITSGIWGANRRINSFLLAESDILTFHNYRPAANLREEIADLKKHHRPVICTEWLNRGRQSTVPECLPIFVEERVGALHWGLVNGKTQTHLPWGHRPGQPDPEVWQHDLFRPDHSPYDPKEIELFRNAVQPVAVSRTPTGK